MEGGLIEAPTMRHFYGIEMIIGRIPDEARILSFRNPLEKLRLAVLIFKTGKAHLSAHGMTMKQDTIVNATLI